MRKAFSLIELLIVILIIGIVYSVGFEGFEIGKPQPKALTPLNLKSTIVSSKAFTGQATLLCIKKCTECYLRRGVSSAFEAYESPIDLRNIKVFTIDKQEALLDVEFGRYQDQKICLLMDFYNNGSNTQLILKNEKYSYFLPAYFDEPQQFENIEDAKDYWLRNSQLVSNQGDYY